MAAKIFWLVSDCAAQVLEWLGKAKYILQLMSSVMTSDKYL